ncbi:Vta1 like-domain-containing protein [Chytriomyces sp. MP71]|nr:Vta1 like-domain-containing protein [Chytriomyces sp. MP71]
MSSASVPEPLKGITSYLQRAEELATRDAVMAYYCEGNYMAAKSAIEANATDSESQLFMLSLLDKLEADKATMGHNEALSNDVVGYAHVENFALGIFTRADNEDRAGKASK